MVAAGSPVMPIALTCRGTSKDCCKSIACLRLLLLRPMQILVLMWKLFAQTSVNLSPLLSSADSLPTKVGAAFSSVEAFDSSTGEDVGFMSRTDREDPNWWFNPENPYAYEIFDLDKIYPAMYHSHDHIGPSLSINVATASLYYCDMLRQGKCNSVLELGCASCFITKQFMASLPGGEIMAVDGAQAAIHECSTRNGVPTAQLRHHDLRLPLHLPLPQHRRFDLAVCTEVAEHIEPPFSSQLVLNLVSHSDLVWFSFEDRTRGNANHLHHSNEQPAAFWVHLFAFYGYAHVRVSDELLQAVEWRGGYVFFNTTAAAEGSIKLPPGIAVGDKIEPPLLKV